MARTANGRNPIPTVLTLANAERPRRRPAQAGKDRPWTSIDTARAVLAPLSLSTPLREEDLVDLQRLAREVSEIANALQGRTEPPAPQVLNELTQQVRGAPTLRFVDGKPQVTMMWWAPTITSELARRIIEELGRCDPSRLRQCAREACSLLFYDTTRSNTQRWHAEDPCGWLERQARHRARSRDL